MEFSGNANELGDVSKSPGKSYLFFLTVKQSPESVYPEKGFVDWQSTSLLDVSGALLMALENPREYITLVLGRTHNRSRSPRLTASS